MALKSTPNLLKICRKSTDTQGCVADAFLGRHLGTKWGSHPRKLHPLAAMFDQKSERYFKMLDVVCQNWRDAFKTYFKPEHVLEWPDLDTLHAVTVKMLDEYDLHTVTNSNLLRYTLMLSTVESKWNDVMNTWYTHSFKIDNYRQNGVLKYTEPSVMSEKILNGIRNHYRSSVAKT